MKKNHLDDYISNLKPLAEQGEKAVAPRHLPMQVKKPASKGIRYFRYVVGSVLSIFFVIFVVNIIKASRRTLDERYQNTEIVKKADRKKVVVIKKVAPKPAQVVKAATPPPPIQGKSVVVAEKQAPAPVATASSTPPHTKTSTSPQPKIVAAQAPTAPVAAPVAAKKVLSAKPANKLVYRHSIPEFFPRPYKPMILAINPPGRTTTQPEPAAPVAAAVPAEEQKASTAFERSAEATQAKKLLAMNTSAQSKPLMNKPPQPEAKTLAAVTKSTTPVIEKPVTPTVTETAKRVPVSVQVASLSPDERMSRAKQLFDQEQWYDACDIYRKEMYNGGHSRSRRHEAVVRAAQCYYKLGYKSTADHLLENVIQEGGSWKKEAKAILEASK